MQLHQHIISERGNRLGAFRVLGILKGAYVSRSVPFPLDSIVNDAWCVREYEKWAERKSEEQSLKLYEYMHSKDMSMKSINLNEINIKTIVHTNFHEVMRIAAEEEGWRIVNLAASSTLSSMPSHAPDFNEDVSIIYKKDIQKDIVILRLCQILPYSVAQVAPLLVDLRRRKEWDVKFHKGNCLQIFDQDSDVCLSHQSICSMHDLSVSDRLFFSLQPLHFSLHVCCVVSLPDYFYYFSSVS